MEVIVFHFSKNGILTEINFGKKIWVSVLLMLFLNKND
jgi:hypothetical protein